MMRWSKHCPDMQYHKKSSLLSRLQMAWSWMAGWWNRLISPHPKNIRYWCINIVARVPNRYWILGESAGRHTWQARLYRGMCRWSWHWRSWRSFWECTYLKIGVKEAKDQVETALYLGKQTYVDKDRIGIWVGVMADTWLLWAWAKELPYSKPE